MKQRAVGGSVALVAVVGAIIAWASRPAFEEVEERLEEQLREEMAGADTGVIERPAAAGELACLLDPSRSRIVGTPVQDITLEWSENGCVNERTQYGLADGEWTRVLVPSGEEAVSVNRFDPETGEYRVERYLLDREAMREARQTRAGFEAPQCSDDPQVARQLGEQQRAILSLLPDQPNERLVYSCSEPAEGE